MCIRDRFRTWLFAIARNRVRDAARARRRAEARVEQDDTADAPDPTADPGDRIDDERLIRALVMCVGQLGAASRAAVLLRYQQGFSFEEMATICGDKPGTLQARVIRALRALSRALEARMGEAPQQAALEAALEAALSREAPAREAEQAREAGLARMAGLASEAELARVAEPVGFG